MNTYSAVRRSLKNDTPALLMIWPGWWWTIISQNKCNCDTLISSAEIDVFLTIVITLSPLSCPNLSNSRISHYSNILYEYWSYIVIRNKYINCKLFNSILQAFLWRQSEWDELEDLLAIKLLIIERHEMYDWAMSVEPARHQFAQNVLPLYR